MDIELMADNQVLSEFEEVLFRDSPPDIEAFRGGNGKRNFSSRLVFELVVNAHRDGVLAGRNAPQRNGVLLGSNSASRSAGNSSPVNRSCLARPIPIRRGKRMLLPAPGTRP